MFSDHSHSKFNIPVSLVTNLIAEQFPQWAHLPIMPVEVSGHDNRTFHLGDSMSVRLPSAQDYAAKVSIEQKWLPFLAQHVSITIPKPLAMGKPSQGYPWNWSVYTWIEGKSANLVSLDEIHDLNTFACALAHFLNELHKIDTTNGPKAGPHNFYRGGSLLVYDAETRSALELLQNVVDTTTALSVWEKALSSQWNNKPVWIHGDLSTGNILLKDGRLTAVIDFGGMGVGDPACDLVIAWTFLTPESRKIFKSKLNLDSETWARARGWALWKALITLVPLKDENSSEALKNQKIIKTILAEHEMECD